MVHWVSETLNEFLVRRADICISTAPSWVKLTKDTPNHPHIGQPLKSYKGQECTQHIVPYAKIWYAYVKEERRSCQTQTHVENIIFMMRSKVKVIQMSWMYLTHCTMVIHSWSNKVWLNVKGQKNWKPCYKIWTWGQRSTSYQATHHLLVIDLCVKYEVTGRTQRHSKNL